MMWFVDDCPTTDRLAILAEDYMRFSKVARNNGDPDIRDRADRRCFLDMLEMWFLTQNCYPLENC